MLAPRLMALLNLKTGDTIDVGDATLRIAGEVIQEPDSGFNPFQIAPRLMMNLAWMLINRSRAAGESGHLAL